MSRAERLLSLLEKLRLHRYPVRGEELARQAGVSLRTLYRDIALLQAQGAHIDGSPGVGYLLRPGFVLPPLMLTEEEIEALVLGSRWVSRHADADLQDAAVALLAKVEAVLPAGLRQQMASNGLLVPRGKLAPATQPHLPQFRKAIRAQLRLTLIYEDAAGAGTERTVWPFALAYFDDSLVLAAWCELRQDYRHFRTDRVRSFKVGEPYARPRRALLTEWQQMMNERYPPANGARADY
jgi:predicted DNA-binding transcriptional regulator YafY